MFILLFFLFQNESIGALQLEERDQRMSDLAFMAGSWAADRNGVLMEEHWTQPAGGMMLGMHRDVKPDGSAFFEVLRIEVRNEELVYLASPRGKPAVAFVYTGGNEKKATFENLQHDYPKRIHYELNDQGMLIASIDGGPDDKKPRQWRYQPAQITRKK